MPDNRYRIIERVAAGGMAEVFRGVAESIQGFRKGVAIKRVLPALTKNKKFVAMFLDEARLSLHLQHANIVQVFDIGHADETYFIVMEFVEGVDLKALLEWRRRIGRLLTIGQTVYMVMEMCKGLAYAHEATHPETGKALGLVHRDVSPPNVLLSRNGEVKMTDFGLAKAAVQVEVTDPGVVKGKMSYLSPEAARGEEVDARADIFAVGILLYEMLTGKRLFYGESDYQTVELVRAAKIPPIAAQNREVEPELEEIVRKSLAKRAEDRFQSATDLQDALAHYLFSRGLKMIQRDIAELVRACVEDQNTLSGAARKAKANVIDSLLQDELESFTSLEMPPEPGAEPLLPTLEPAGAGGPGGDFVDPRAWAQDPDWPARRTTGQRSVTPAGNAHVAGPLAFAAARPSMGTAIPAPSAPPPAYPPTPGPVATPIPSFEPPRGMPAGYAPVAHAPHRHPTPGPDTLADALEPPRLPPQPEGKVGRGLIIGVVVAALVVGAVLAAVLVR
jgi:serine/threonine-protein kinase